ncbi:hypothetical protein Golomagni_00167 [Golovinomyces magnicellulatus]|nr:hypothetical protein Golomagni_00167 [Golovinomyces magnicellulatus]
MSVRIDIDDPRAVRTNYDTISGRILIFVKTDVKISTILVKLEGESRTQLVPSSNGHFSKSGLVIETHKILYHVQQVFPDRSPSSCSTSNILRAGKHGFVFNFQIPLQNQCVDYQLTPSEINVGESRVADAQRQIQNMHVKRLLPPSLMGHPGFAEIRYFIKVTVRHPQIFKESWRSMTEFNFSPLEPVRPSLTGEELKTSIPFAFKTKIDLTTASQIGARPKLANSLDIAPKGELHARLPWPAIIRCKETIPLKLIVRKLNRSSEPIFLVSFALNVLERIKVKVNEQEKTEVSAWVIANLSGLSVQIGSSFDREGTETVINHSLWDKFLLPNTIAPSFGTCNIKRNYELDIRVGLSYGALEKEKASSQIIYLPLRLPIIIYSGVSPKTNSAIVNRSAGTQDFASVEDLLPSYEEVIAHADITSA